ncbi:E1 ubiquitin-activating protein UBA2 NDAI_0A04330 [Naumovozyma dairenensis CBS 421]|uniref:Ubiquitin-activating enzyme E1-like n=1 Tax=Naumovozyma dairenensis (strain ATCC 10597 / BCRC 20456 / CBS 421 / NBRC 0211 / NRRL Y-12639) TaxID=1071378 RepID=G0W452_NAUDC|nr:hypothetical protein NDAI_0A04330 [Naumovozyma dairenensis CBS 421]CCD22590.1 hypothetical protein NDAI_0A04330 [Naumovozyma dairenensis CBS 421]
MPRETNIVKIVGQESYDKLRSTKCLLVGAGGIGSELLKDLILMEFGEIHIVDLDTIDLSNLNRQFLFRQRDIKQPKSTTAVKAVQHFSNSKLVPYQGNIMDTNEFPLHWFHQFDIIFNALDNLSARRYVNKMSQFLQTPLLESGTSGFDGYIQPIIPGKTECFDCTKKETPKTFPVCTIRSTPSQPIHCIVWAKNFLFNQIFSAESTSNEEEEDGTKEWGTDDVEEIKRIKQETNELHELQKIITFGDKSRIPEIVEKLFIHDIEKLLLIENLWKTRTKPTPLTKTQLDASMNESKKDLHLNNNSVWNINEQLSMFLSITGKLMERMKKEHTIEFDKDDQDTLEFVATAANIRSHIFDIPLQSVFDIKQIAGNIIPAIATTNAIIAGLSALVSLRVLNLLKYAPVKTPLDLNMAMTAKASNLSQDRYISNPTLARPNCECAVCTKVTRGVVIVSDPTITLKEFIAELRSKYGFSEDISLLDLSEQRLLVDYDFDDMVDRSLDDVNLKNGSLLFFCDEEENDAGMCRKPLELYLELRNEISGQNIPKIILPELDITWIKPSSAEPEENEAERETSKEKVGGNDGAVIILDDDEAQPSTGTKRSISELDNGFESDNKKAKVAGQFDDNAIIELD